MTIRFNVSTMRTTDEALYAIALCMSDPLMDPRVYWRATTLLTKAAATEPRELAVLLSPFLRGLGIATGMTLRNELAIRLHQHSFGEPPADDPAPFAAWTLEDGEYVRLGLGGRTEWGALYDDAIDADAALGLASLPAFVDAEVGALIAAATDTDIYNCFYAVRYTSSIEHWLTACRVLAWMVRDRGRMSEALLVMLAAASVVGGDIDTMDECLRDVVEHARQLDATPSAARTVRVADSQKRL